MITGILHASLLSSDLARSRAFYEGVLGLQPDPSRPEMSYDGVWYNVAPNQQIHLLLLPNPEAGLPRPTHPQGVRRGCKGLITKSGNLLLNKLSAKLTQPQQHTQHGGRDRHVALAVSDLAQLIERLNQAGVAYTLSSSGRRALFCRDPDGNALELI
jgi:catechol 2,3-dioxygenase-like lactoylglutathione lyase family enzyme